MLINMDRLRENKQPHIVFEGICLKCLYRAIIVTPAKLLLKDIQCGKCGAVGYVIKTGQELNNENK